MPSGEMISLGGCAIFNVPIRPHVNLHVTLHAASGDPVPEVTTVLVAHRGQVAVAEIAPVRNEVPPEAPAGMPAALCGRLGGFDLVPELC